MTDDHGASLPKVLLDDLGVLHCGQSPTVADVNTNGDGFLYVTGPEQWQDGKVLRTKWTTAPKRIAPDNSIFITVKGAGVGKMAFGVECAIGRDVYAFEPSPLLNDKFIFWAIKEGVNEIVLKAQGDIPGLSKAHILEHEIRLPPINEQRRIVEKIEVMFDEIDAGVQSLQTARTTLGLYRQSLLKSAFEGRLTADWRAQNADKLEAPETLLERAEYERDSWHRTAFEEWSEVVEAWEATGSKGPKPRRPEVYKPSAPLTAAERAVLPTIPEEWIFLRLNDVAAIGSGMSVSKSRKFEDPIEVPYLRVANVQRGYLDLEEIKTMQIERSQADSLGLATWDVLFNEGGDRDKLGRGWVWESQIPNCITQNHVFRASPYRHDLTWSQFISHWGNSFGRDYFEKGGKQTTNLASINKTVLKALPVPYCSPAEQAEIIRRLDARLEAADALEAEIDAALTRADAMRQSILKQAFSGHLVPQDPDDEPASALLERIKAERVKAPKKTRKKAPA